MTLAGATSVGARTKSNRAILLTLVRAVRGGATRANRVQRLSRAFGAHRGRAGQGVSGRGTLLGQESDSSGTEVYRGREWRWAGGL